jgi:hypothetical protein
MPTKSDVVKLDNEAPVFRRLTAGEIGLGTLLDTMIAKLNGLMDVFRTDGYVFNAAGLAIGTVSKAKVKVVNDVYFFLAGASMHVTAAEVAFTATTHDIAGHATLDKEAFYLLSADSAGAVTVTKGTTATAPNAVMPATPANEIAFASVRILVELNATPAVFDATTDELDEAHLTVTYADIHGTVLTDPAVPVLV